MDVVFFKLGLVIICSRRPFPKAMASKGGIHGYGTTFKGVCMVVCLYAFILRRRLAFLHEQQEGASCA